MEVKVEKSDICRIGHTVKSFEGNTVFYCYFETAGLEYILLRNILQCFGREYMVVGNTNVIIGNDSVVFYTNLPWQVYEDVKE